MKNWKSTLAGLVTAAAGFVLFSPEHFQQWPVVVSLAKYVTVGGLASLGLLTKDFNAHSTADQVTQSTIEADNKAIASVNRKF